ncbi:MAG: HAMP domain-containing protein [Deltaproteobacteria bacterium]|nr:HAMP domain-containing protein [Deltaproteobacteria bacterium]
MWKSIKYQLTAAFIFLVVTSGLIISQTVTYYYEKALRNNAIQQAKHIALQLSLNLGDKILTNNLVAIQKQLEDQKLSTPSVAYLFVVKNKRILAHTFSGGFPAGLLAANSPTDNNHARLKKIISKQEDRYLDIAQPIVDGKAGILRLGYSETAYKNAVSRLHVKIALLILTILFFALMLSHLFIRLISKPLSDLTKAVEQIDADCLTGPIHAKGSYEIKKLGRAFNRMLERINEYTQSLKNSTEIIEIKNIELDRIHRQSKVSLEISQKINALSDLQSVGKFLIDTMHGIVKCQQITLLVFSRGRSTIFLYSKEDTQTVEGSDVEKIADLLNPLTQMKFIKRTKIPLSISEFKNSVRIAVFPIRYEENLIGAMAIGCPGDCQCVTNELDVIHLILNVNAGVILREVNREDEILAMRKRIDQTSSYCGIIGKDSKMQVIYRLIDDVAPSDSTILIQGESGTGKELVAEAIHEKSPRSKQPFVVINCAAYPEALIESELFGYEKGAFTGASQRKTGRFEQADGGTVFLDEIGEISGSIQVKLLRVLQSKKFERIGGQKTLSVDVRVIAATNRDIMLEVQNGRFREDLFYRLNVIPVYLPPLRNRRNDIPLLARNFLRRFAFNQGKTAIRDFTAGAMRIMLDYHWPGNVRELENSVEHAVVLTKDKLIHKTDLPNTCRTDIQGQQDSMNRETLEQTEKQHLLKTLEICNWKKAETARRLGIGRSTLYLKLKKYNIKPPA